VRDITGRKQAEAAIKAEEIRFRHLFNGMSSGVAVFEATPDGQDFIIRDMNPAAEQIEKVKKEVVAGRRVTDIFPGVAEFGLLEVLRKVWETGTPQKHPISLYRDTRISGWRENFVYRLPSGEVVTIFNDVTENKKAEDLIRDQLREITFYYDNAPIGLAVLDKDLRFLRINTLLADMNGIPAADHIGKTIQELLPSFADTVEQFTQEILSTGQPKTNIELTGETPALPGVLRTWRESWCPVRDAEGTINGFSVFVEDITGQKEAQYAREQYSARLNSAMEIGNLAWWEMDVPSGAVRFDNRKTAMLGYSPEMFHHYSDFTGLLHPGDYEPTMQAMRDHLEGRKDRYSADYRIRASDGTYRWFRDIGGVTKRQVDGSPATVTGIVIDITSTKQAEEALQESERKFRTFADLTYDWEYWTNPDGEYIYISPACERISGYSPVEFYKNKNLIRQLVHPEDREIFLRHKTTLPKIPDPQTLDFRIVTKDGRVVWIGHICRPVFSFDGQFLGRRGSNRDITLRVIAENALEENQARLTTAMDLAHLVNWEYDVKAGTFTFNDPFYALYGTTARNEGGYLMPAETYVREFVHPDDIPYVTGVIEKVASGTDPDYVTEAEHRIIRRDGEMRFIVVRFGVIINATGQLVKTYGINQDITNRKLMESEIRSLNQVLEQRVAERTEQLNSSLKEKELLLREIHHRVKNNIQVIASLLNWQSNIIKDEKTREQLQDAQDRVRSIALVHENLYQSQNLEAIDYQEYLKKNIQYLYHTHSVNPERIAVRVVGDTISLTIDKAIPCGLIVNEMITNAFKHAFPGNNSGTVDIGLFRQGPDIRLEYHDNGCGLPDSVTLDKTKSLGMMLISGLSRQLKGSITIGREGGTHYVLIFPA
jgi:PAS domain S-box-containing protein